MNELVRARASTRNLPALVTTLFLPIPQPTFAG
jgi:hypothetical protein